MGFYSTQQRKSILTTQEGKLKQIVEKLNILKPDLKDFNTTMLYESGKLVKLPYSHSIMPILMKAGLIYSNPLDKYYNFTSKEITYDNLYNYWIEFKEKESENKVKNYKLKIVDKELQALDNIDLEKALKIVKHFGYKIFKEI